MDPILSQKKPIRIGLFAASLAFLVLSTTLFSPRVHAVSGACEAAASGDDGLLSCYEKDYQDRFNANESRLKVVLKRSKDLLQDASENNQKEQVRTSVDLIHKINQTVVQSRKNSVQACLRLAAKFISSSTARIAGINCRTDEEVKLDRQLRQFELQLETLALGPEA